MAYKSLTMYYKNFQKVYCAYILRSRFAHGELMIVRATMPDPFQTLPNKRRAESDEGGTLAAETRFPRLSVDWK